MNERQSGLVFHFHACCVSALLLSAAPPADKNFFMLSVRIW